MIKCHYCGKKTKSYMAHPSGNNFCSADCLCYWMEIIKRC